MGQLRSQADWALLLLFLLYLAAAKSYDITVTVLHLASTKEFLSFAGNSLNSFTLDTKVAYLKSTSNYLYNGMCHAF